MSHEQSTRFLPMFNAALTHSPRAVLEPRSAAEVADAIRAAAAMGEKVYPVGTGHGWVHPISDGFALRTTGLARVQVDPEAEVVTVGAGSTWADVLTAAVPYDLAPVAGSAPGVGAVGYLLGGGLSPLGRSYGWGSDYLRSAEVVIGSGEVVVASPTSHPDLFWALRGGKEVPGVVTEVTLGLVSLSTLYAGGLFYDAADTEAVLSEWASWSALVPEEVNTSVALLRLPGLPSVPEPLRDRFVVHVRIAIPADGRGEFAPWHFLVEPMRKIATPILDTVALMPVTGLGSIHADPDQPMPTREAGALLSGFGAEAVVALLDVVGPDQPAPLAMVEIRRLGGRLGLPAVTSDAVVGREAAYSLFVVSAPDPELFDGPIPATVSALAQAMAPWADGTFQPNFIGSLNRPGAVQAGRSGHDRERLERIRADYDPAGVIGH